MTELLLTISFLVVMSLLFPLQAALLLSKIPKEIVGEPIDAKRLYDAVNVIISLQVNFGF